MRARTLAAVLLVKAVEDIDAEGTLLPLADRAAASREAARERGEPTDAADLVTSAGPLSPRARELLGTRAEILRGRLTTRFPVVDSALALVDGPWWLSALLLGLAGAAGFTLSALDGSRRINVLAFPLLGLVLWNLIVYLGLAGRRLRAGIARELPRRPLARLLAQRGLAGARRIVARSAAFNVPLAAALGRFVGEWAEAAGPALAARATRLLHLGAAASGLGLIAGFYVRGLILDYQAGWESTFLTAERARALLRVLYGPASLLTGIPVPDAAHLATIRWPAGAGESAAPWIHLLAATALLFVVLPRLALALGASVIVWRHRLRAPVPPSLPSYFRRVFGQAAGGPGRGIVAVVPYAYAPSVATAAALAQLLPAALGEHLAVDMRAPVHYGEEDEFVERVAERGGTIADAIALLFTLAATPEDQNHGTVIAGVRDWLARGHRQTELLVLVDAGPYAERMGGPAGPTERLAARRRAWEAFVAARGVTACVLDLAATADTDTTDAVECLRGARWQPAPA
jgi:hypothetical protein